MDMDTLQYQPKTMTDLEDLAGRLINDPSSITAAEKRFLSAVVSAGADRIKYEHQSWGGLTSEDIIRAMLRTHPQS